MAISDKRKAETLGISGKLFKTGILLLVTSLVVLVFSTYSTFVGNEKQESSSGEMQVLPSVNQNQDISQDWEEYKNEEYGFSVEIPRLLSKRDSRNQGEYLYFIRFEENRFSRGKGLAIGVSNLGLEEQEKRIVEALEDSGSSVGPERKEFESKGTKIIKLEYPEGEGTEARTIVIFDNGKYTFSISSTPSQIDKVVSSFKFLNP